MSYVGFNHFWFRFEEKKNVGKSAETENWDYGFCVWNL